MSADPEAHDTGRGEEPQERVRPAADPEALRADSDCDRILERMHDFLDHELDEASVEAIRAHLLACEHCLDDYDVAQAVKEVVSRCCRAERAPQQLRMTIVTSMTRWRAG